jgi:hypothetical protein
LGLLLLSGCAFRSPVLLFCRQSTTNPKQFPLRVGVAVRARRDQDPTSIFTYHFPVLTFSGQFPKPVEMEYFADSVVDYLRDRAVFRYTYPYPFDPADVDLVLFVEPRQARLTNDSLYGSLMPLAAYLLPFPGFLIPLVLPQEKFSGRFVLEFRLRTPDGQDVATYETKETGDEWVWLWEQPYANYLWYRSIFRTRFLEMLDDVKARMEKDSALIMAAASPRRP